jgi:hypothetical protein
MNQNIKENDIVFIKFKDITEILKLYSNMRVSEFIAATDLNDHIDILVSGGHFLVNSIVLAQDSELPLATNQKDKLPEITIRDHKVDYNFTFNENFIEEIRIENENRSYFNSKFGISLVFLGEDLSINGKQVSKEDEDLMQILEQVISNYAVNKMLSQD